MKHRAFMDDSMNQQRPATSRAAKLELRREKLSELEGLNQIKDQSAQLGQHFNTLASHIQTISEGCQSVGNVVGNWDYAFWTMGVMNTEGNEGASNPTIVNLPIVSKNDNTF